MRRPTPVLLVISLAIGIWGCGPARAPQPTTSLVEIKFQTVPARDAPVARRPLLSQERAGVSEAPVPSEVSTIFLDIISPGSSCDSRQIDPATLPADGSYSLGERAAGMTHVQGVALDGQGRLLYHGYAIVDVPPGIATSVGMRMSQVDLMLPQAIGGGPMGCRLTVLAVERPSGTPLSGSRVSLGPTGTVVGVTNAQGVAMLTSQTPMSLPQDVHLFAAGHTAHSIIGVNAALLILSLDPLTPPARATGAGAGRGLTEGRNLLVHGQVRDQHSSKTLASVTTTTLYSLGFMPSQDLVNVTAFEFNATGVTNFATALRLGPLTSSGMMVTKDLIFPTTSLASVSVSGTVAVPASFVSQGKIKIRTFANDGFGGRVLAGIDPAFESPGGGAPSVLTTVGMRAFPISFPAFSNKKKGYSVEVTVDLPLSTDVVDSAGRTAIRLPFAELELIPTLTLTLPEMPTQTTPAAGATGVGMTPLFSWAASSGMTPTLYLVQLRPPLALSSVTTGALPVLWTLAVPAKNALASVALPTVPSGASSPLTAGVPVDWTVANITFQSGADLNSYTQLDLDLAGFTEARSQPRTFTP